MIQTKATLDVNVIFMIKEIYKYDVDSVEYIALFIGTKSLTARPMLRI